MPRHLTNEPVEKEMNLSLIRGVGTVVSIGWLFFLLFLMTGWKKDKNNNEQIPLPK